MSIFAVFYEMNLPNLHCTSRNNVRMAMNIETRRSIRPKFWGGKENLRILHTYIYLSIIFVFIGRQIM